MQHEERRVQSFDGLELHAQCWRPDGVARGVVLMVHGLGEHSGRYGNVVDALVPRGYCCWGFDYRGHGRSPGRRVHVGHFREYTADLAAALGTVRAAHDEPIVALGHSQGGLVVTDLALSRPEGLAGIVLSSPLLGIHPDRRPGLVLAAAARVLSRVAPTLSFNNEVGSGYLSHDSEVVAAYDADPLVSHRVSARWFTTTLEVLADVNRHVDELAVPALVMQSGDDHLVDAAATRAWAARAPAELVEYVEWPGLYHEMFNEPQRDEVLARVAGWLDRLLGEASRKG